MREELFETEKSRVLFWPSFTQKCQIMGYRNIALVSNVKDADKAQVVMMPLLRQYW